MSMLASFIESVSQADRQTDRQTRWMRALRSLGPAPDDPPTAEADLLSCSASRGK